MYFGRFGIILKNHDRKIVITIIGVDSPKVNHHWWIIIMR